MQSFAAQILCKILQLAKFPSDLAKSCQYHVVLSLLCQCQTGSVNSVAPSKVGRFYRCGIVIELSINYHISGITPLHITMISNDKIGTDILIRFGANPKLLVSIFYLCITKPKIISLRQNVERWILFFCSTALTSTEWVRMTIKPCTVHAF